MILRKIKSVGKNFFYGLGSAILLFCSVPILLDLYNNGAIKLTTLINISPGISISLAFYAIGFTLSSDVKMAINSNENFLRIVDRFEDMRIDMFQHNAKSKPDYSKIFKTCWKCATYLERAVKLYEMANIDEENKSKLFQQVEQLIYFSELPWLKRYRIKIKDNEGNIVNKLMPVIEKKTIEHLNRSLELCYELKINKSQIQKVWELTGHIENFK